MTIASAALLLFLILDPLGNIPVFLSLLKGLPPARQRVVIVRELLIALAVLMVFLWAGRYLLELMHLRQESVSIAGGIILFLIGLLPDVPRRVLFPYPIALVFMLMASCNFALYFVALVKRQPLKVLRDPEWRASIGLLVGVSLLIAALLWFKGHSADLADIIRMSLFNVISIGSTTGYSTVDYTQWPVFAPIVMIILSGIATSAGSTGAGIKMARMVILVKQARREMNRLVHPRAVQPVCLGGGVVDNRVIFSVLAFMLVYGGTVFGLSMVMLLTDLDPVTAFSVVLASVNCAGPGLGSVGPASNYAVLTDFQIWVCTLAMLLGRLEILSFMALLTPAFWRR